MLPSRTLLVSWRWNDLADSTAGALHICPVSYSANDRLVRLHQRAGRDGVTNWLKKDFTLNQQHAAEYIVLLHGSVFAEEDAGHIKESLAHSPHQSDIHYFGSGNGFIYYTPSTDTGFLDHEGNFADEFDKDIRIRDEHGGLHHPCFHKVWRHYRHRAKRKLDDAHTFTNRFLNPSIESAGLSGTAAELMRKHRPEYLVEVESLLNLLREHYDDEADVQEQVKKFARLLSEKHLSSGRDLIEISEQFEELLAAIKEHDY
ncbi:MAG: hypothetical protein ACKVUS_18355 [Saprospiraceae bacterium]